MNKKLADYAKLIVKTGVNLKRDQLLVINAPIECATFARYIASAAYEVGAKDVIISWGDEEFTKLRFLKAPDAVFDEFPSWRKAMYIDYAKQGAAFVSIAAANPELLQDVKPERVARAQKASSLALKEYRERLMGNQNQWCVVSVPTIGWAKKVYPNDSNEVAVEKLWQAILETVRVDGKNDPVVAWQKHQSNLEKYKNFMNEQQFSSLKYKNSLGTDLTIELPKGHIWASGADYTPDGRPFIANMPTEEVFTMPKRNGVNGKVVSAKPLNYNGNLIDKFTLIFQDGKVIDYKAEIGQEILGKLLEVDEGAAYLGEVALVPYNSPISNLNILFYNTLFDENAACHLALGKAYPTCIKDGDKMDKAAMLAAGVNDSLIHEDFMIGTDDLEIIGITGTNETVPVFKNGNFANK